MKDALPDRVRLGAYEVDLRAGELRSESGLVRLQQQPFRILLMLVQHAGDIVTRDQIQRRLWPNDTVVEFDHSINAAIKKLRQAFGDSADTPTYIETVARRGYRLVARVEPVPAASSSSTNRITLRDGPTLMPARNDRPGQVGAPVSRFRIVQRNQDAEANNKSSAQSLPPVEMHSVAPARDEAAILIGRKVSHYRVLKVIGAGGMGLVYKAEDLKLGRQVALKFLPEELAWDPIALRRFEREAKTASSLDHPNICTVYGVEEFEERPFLVMQLLEGETLRDRLGAAAAGHAALPLDQLLDIASQMSEGLQAAHSKDVIHRDIKPANIFLTTCGRVKILDFGLAKLMSPTEEWGSDRLQVTDGVPAIASASPSRLRDASLTRMGAAPGTAGYMSPEQVRDEKLDARSDIFSLGLVLYEMATGHRAFGGDSPTGQRDAILNHTPTPVRELNPYLPAPFEAIITKALAKDREQRYQSAEEFHDALATIRKGREMPQAIARGQRWKHLALVAVVLLLSVAGILYWRSRRRVNLAANSTIVIADLSNKTTEPALGETLTTALQVELNQTPFLEVLGEDKIRGTLKMMNHSEDERLTPAIAREVCSRTRSAAVVTGMIADAGNHYQLSLNALNCQNGETLASASGEAKSRSVVVATLGTLGAQLRESLGEPTASLRKFDKPLALATSPSLDALQAYTQALAASGGPTTVPLLQRALESDPDFASAYALLGDYYVTASEVDLSSQNLKKAYDLRDRLTPRQRYSAEAQYYFLDTGEFDKAIETYKQWADSYPSDFTPHSDLGLLHMILGHYEQAAGEERTAYRLAPEDMSTVVYLMYADCQLNRPEEADKIFKAAQSRNMDSDDMRAVEYEAAFLRNDTARMKEQVAWVEAHPGSGDSVVSTQADTESYHGRLKRSRELSQRAVGIAGRDAPERAAVLKLDNALLEAEIGDPLQGRERAAQALALSRGKDVTVPAALSLARAGDTAGALQLAEKLNLQFPKHTMVQGYSLPLIHAAVALQENNPDKALECLQNVRALEGADMASLTGYPSYVRGLAYLKLARAPEAAAEFKKITSRHSGNVTGVLKAVSHLQLGRAQAMMGDTTNARKSYQQFLALWKDADSDIPVYQQARREFAKLQRTPVSVTEIPRDLAEYRDNGRE